MPRPPEPEIDACSGHPNRKTRRQGERRLLVGAVARRLGTPTSGRHSGPQGRGGEDPNRRDSSRLGTYPPTDERRGGASERRPPGMGTVPRREPSRCLARRDSARLRRAVPTGGRRSKRSARSFSGGDGSFATFGRDAGLKTGAPAVTALLLRRRYAVSRPCGPRCRSGRMPRSSEPEMDACSGHPIQE